MPHAAASAIAPAPEAKRGAPDAASSAGQHGEKQAPPAGPGTSFAPTSTAPDPQLPVLAPVTAKLDTLGRIRVPVLAFTATWARSDRLALGKVIEKIVWHCDWLDLVRGKWCVLFRWAVILGPSLRFASRAGPLKVPFAEKSTSADDGLRADARRLSDISFTTVHLDGAVDLTQVAVSEKTGDFKPASLSRALNSDATNELVLKAYLENAAGASLLHLTRAFSSCAR